MPDAAPSPELHVPARQCIGILNARHRLTKGGYHLRALLLTASSQPGCNWELAAFGSIISPGDLFRHRNSGPSRSSLADPPTISPIPGTSRSKASTLNPPGVSLKLIDKKCCLHASGDGSSADARLLHLPCAPRPSRSTAHKRACMLPDSV